MKGKITIIGAGHVGSHVARALAAGDIGSEIVLVDILPEKAAAQAMDVADALSYPSRDTLVRAGDYADCADADVTVVAIGKPREPGQTRLDLLGDSTRMIAGLARDLAKAGVGGPVVSITNPCDIMADLLGRLLGLDRFRVFGTGTLLDTARLMRTLSEQTGVPRGEITAWVLGEHGDSSTIPFSCVRLAGRAPETFPGFDGELALERTHGIGMDIINGKGSTEFGIGQATAFLIRNMLEDTGAVLPLSVRLTGEYGLRVQCGVPCGIGRGGIRRILELPLTPPEQAALARSADVLARHTRLAEELLGGV